jgi:HK97 family phage portal protein
VTAEPYAAPPPQMMERLVKGTPASTALVPYEPDLIRVSMYGADGKLQVFAMPRPRSSTPGNAVPSVPTSSAGNVGLFALINQRGGYQIPASTQTYRAWYEASPWVFACVSILQNAVASAEWDILTVDKDGPKSVRTARRVRELFEEPNGRDTFRDFIQKIVCDLGVLDGAPVEKVRYPTGELAQLWPTPGELVAVNSRWTGDPDETRFIYSPDGSTLVKFSSADMFYNILNPQSRTVLGLSPLTILRRAVDAELNGVDYNSRMTRGAPPEGVLDIGETATPTDVVQAKSDWESNILGQSAFAVIGGYKNPQFIKFRDTNQDMQFREWMDYLVRQHAVVYGLSPQDLGITFDVNRSTAETQSDNSESRGVRPLMSMLQSAFTRHVVHDESFGGKANNLRFVWTALNLKESMNRAAINKIAVGSTPWKTVNEARVMDGRDPIGELGDDNNVFNHILSATPKGLMDITTGKYIGEADLASIQADSAIDVATATAEARAANPDKTMTADMAAGGQQK